MPKKRKPEDPFSELTWADLEAWAGFRIVSRAKNYQRQGVVSNLAQTADGALVAWVDGSKRYATLVEIDEHGEPESVCTCPYGNDCKHAVATVLEYLAYRKADKPVPKVKKNDQRLTLLDSFDAVDDDYLDDLFEGDESETDGKGVQEEVKDYLSGKTKKELIQLFLDAATRHPEIYATLLDQKQLAGGKVKPIVARIRREIKALTEEPGWRNYWDDRGYTPDYSKIRKDLTALLEAGHADDVLSLGKELMVAGAQQVEMSHDEGETATEISDCMPVILNALEPSSLAPVDKLAWAVDAVLKDEYDLFEVFAEYLHRKHTKADWDIFADRLLKRLKSFQSSKRGDKFSRDYQRDRLSDWIIHALKQAGRTDEMIELCETEADKTGSYERLVNVLLTEKRLAEAEQWILKGLNALGKEWPGVTSTLRAHLRDIRAHQKDWLAVAALQVYEFVDRPSWQSYKDCEKATDKVKAWPDVRKGLLTYLETGTFPWDTDGWPLPPAGLTPPEKHPRTEYPCIEELIDIAIYEKQPEKVLHWYDQRPKQRYHWFGSNDDKIATAVKNRFPDRAIDIWKTMAETQIDQVKPKAYQEAAVYLRKAAKLLEELQRTAEWERYLQSLRDTHIRKRRLMEILDSLEGKPILRS